MQLNKTSLDLTKRQLKLPLFRGKKWNEMERKKAAIPRSKVTFSVKHKNDIPVS